MNSPTVLSRCQSRRRLGRRLPRRPPLRNLAAARTVRSGHVHRRACRPRATRRCLQGKAPGGEARALGAPIKAAILDQRTGSLTSKYLRRRGTGAAKRAPLDTGERAHARRGEGRAQGRARLTAGRRAPAGLDAPRLPAARRVERNGAGQVQGLRPRRASLRALRHADRQDPGCCWTGCGYRPHCQVSYVGGNWQSRGSEATRRAVRPSRRRGRGARARCNRRSHGRRSGSAGRSSRP